MIASEKKRGGSAVSEIAAGCIYGKYMHFIQRLCLPMTCSSRSSVSCSLCIFLMPELLDSKEIKPLNPKGN